MGNRIEHGTQTHRPLASFHICWLIESAEKPCSKETKMIYIWTFPCILDIQSFISIFHPSQVLRLSGTHCDTCSASTTLAGTNGPWGLASFFWGWRPCLLYFLALATCPSYSLAPGLSSFIPHGLFPQVLRVHLCLCTCVSGCTSFYSYCSM